MKKFKKITSLLLTAILTLSMCVTGVSATEELLTSSTEVDVHKGDTVNLWVELELPEDAIDVIGWTVDMYFDNSLLNCNTDFADGYGFASGTAAVDYALGLTDVEVDLPGGKMIQCGLKNEGKVSAADINNNGFRFAGKTTKLVCVQLNAIEDGTATLSYKVRDLVDKNYKDNSYLDKTTYQPIGGADCALKYEVVCDHEVPTEPTEAPTEEPTEEPTEVPTEAPTEEPTEAPTEAPTEEPTDAPTEAPTEEPTEATEPPITDVTLKFAVPTSTIRRFDWSIKDVVFYYGKTTDVNEDTTIPMTATNDKYYTEDTGTNTLIYGGNGWTIYEVVIPKEDIEDVQSSRFVGFATTDGINRTTHNGTANILKAGIDTYTEYSTTAVNLSEVNGKTFIIKDSQWGSNSAVSYIGYWLTDYNTIRFAAPFNTMTYYNWDDVEFFYTNDDTFDTATKLQMVKTADTTKIKDTGSDYLKTGNWYVYAVSVDKNTATEIESSSKTGFAKPNATNKTTFSKNVFTAKVDEFDGTYSDTAKTLDEVEGMIFVIQAPSLPTSKLTFDGEWQTEEKYTQGNDDLVTIKFAAPIGTAKQNDWNSGVEIYYSNSTDYKNASRITMTKTSQTVPVTIDETILESLKSGDWVVYEAQLTLEQVKAIDSSTSIGFVKAGSWNRTTTNEYRSIVKASRTEGVTTYTGIKESIEIFDGLTFVINGEFNPTYETSTYTGSWIA